MRGEHRTSEDRQARGPKTKSYRIHCCERKRGCIECDRGWERGQRIRDREWRMPMPIGMGRARAQRHTVAYLTSCISHMSIACAHHFCRPMAVSIDSKPVSPRSKNRHFLLFAFLRFWYFEGGNRSTNRSPFQSLVVYLKGSVDLL